jgi:periplasmic protein TonB
VFDEVMKQEGGKAAAKRAGYVFGSTLFQAGLIVAVLAVSTYVKKNVIDEPVVDVKFVQARQAPPPPPPPPAAPRPKRPPSEQKPRTDLPKPPPPQALIQPQEIQAEMKRPDPSEPPEPQYDYGDDNGQEGVVGGVVGGAPTNQIEDAPAFATAGYKKPQMLQPRCVEQAVRIPKGLEGYVSGPVTVKFAIRKDGQPERFDVMTSVPDQRIGAAIWKAVQECKWVPGSDAQGKPVSIWVILPIRFAGS